MSKWDQRFMNLANEIATWSKDPSTGVGAVIVDDKNRIVSVGFNGYPRNVNDTYTDRESKLRRTIHAEDNAILFANRDLEGCTIYVSHPPCAHCTAKIIQTGITRIVSHGVSVDFYMRWRHDFDEAEDLMKEANIRLEKI